MHLFMTMMALLGVSPLLAQDTKPACEGACPAGESKGCAVMPCDVPSGGAPSCAPSGCAAGEMVVETITVAAANGDPIAQYILASMTEAGQGVTQDAAKAAEMYATAVPSLQKAADEGNPRACKVLARAYAEGKGVTPDPVKAEAYMKKAKECRAKKGCCKGKKGHKHGAPHACCVPAPSPAGDGAAPASAETPADAPAASDSTVSVPAESAAAEVVEMTVEGEAAPAPEE